MDMNEPLHILRQLGILNGSDSVVSLIMVELTNNLKRGGPDKLIEIANKLLAFINYSSFSPVWMTLLGEIAIHNEKAELTKFLEDITKQEMECYKKGRDWLPLPVLEQLFLVYLPSLEQRLLIMLEKLLTDPSCFDNMGDFIEDSHLVRLGHREAHIYHCVCSMLDSLIPYSAKIRDVKKCFMSLVNEIPNTCRSR